MMIKIIRDLSKLDNNVTNNVFIHKIYLFFSKKCEFKAFYEYIIIIIINIKILVLYIITR